MLLHGWRIENAIDRLQGTQFVSNVRTGGEIERRTFSMIDEGGMVRNEAFTRNDYCEIRLSRWLMRAIEANEVVSISRDYFRLRRPLERRLYEIARNQELCPKVGDGLKRAAYHCGVESRRQSQRERICHYGQIYCCTVRTAIGIFT